MARWAPWLMAAAVLSGSAPAAAQVPPDEPPPAAGSDASPGPESPAPESPAPESPGPWVDDTDDGSAGPWLSDEQAPPTGDRRGGRKKRSGYHYWGDHHGSGHGHGDSRGRGAGDGTGARRPHADELETTLDDETSVLDELDLTPSAQYRLRYRHFEGRDFTTGGAADFFTHRARLGLSATWAKRLGAFVQLQDVRVFGEEFDTMLDHNADGLDMHQAYARFMPVNGLELRAGRQEIALANQQLVGLRDWIEPAQSFDGGRATFRRDALLVDGFFAVVRESSTDPGSPDAADQTLSALHIRHELIAPFRSSVIGVLHRDDRSGKKQATMGAIFDGSVKKIFNYELEGYYQFGAADNDIDYSAFLFTGTARVTLADVLTKPYLQIHGALLSGDDDPNDRTKRTFERPFAYRHAPFGEMDFFINMAQDTGERGLRDVAGSVGFEPFDDLQISATHHLFQTMADRNDELDHFGHELDLKAQVKFWKYARIATFYGVFFPGAVFKSGVVDPDPEHFAYTTVEVTF
jgi:hypothetical protein